LGGKPWSLIRSSFLSWKDKSQSDLGALDADPSINYLNGNWNEPCSAEAGLNNQKNSDYQQTCY